MSSTKSSGGNPTVTIITSTYNRSNTLRYAVKSVLAQSFMDFEYLIMDDGCTDDTKEVVKSATAGDCRITLHTLPKNSGNQVVPNNLATTMARGEYIAYLGHDDLWHSSHLSTIVNAVEGHDLANTIAVLYTRRTLLSGITEDGKHRRLMVLPVSSVIHRRDLVDRIGPWKSRMDQWKDTGEYMPPDNEFITRAYDSGASIVSVPKLTVFKFPSNNRSYIDRPYKEQEVIFAKLRECPNFNEEELWRILLKNYGGSRYGSRNVEIKKNKPGLGHPAWRNMRNFQRRQDIKSRNQDQ